MLMDGHSFKKTLFLYFLIGTAAIIAATNLVSASATNGTIDATNKYAWGPQIGWINFGATNGNVHITNSGLTGYAWSQNYGWINLNPSQGGVKNDGSGNLSGTAWGETIGYVDFGGVKINSSGKFTGAAASASLGAINFDCSNCVVTTDWSSQAASASASTQPTQTGGGGGSAYFPPPASAVPLTASVLAQNLSVFQKTLDYLKTIFSNISGNKANKEINISKIAPPSMQGSWTLLPAEAIGKFVFGSLSKDILSFTQKFPSIKKIFADAGVSRESDLSKLRGINLLLPNLSEELGSGVSGGQLLPIAQIAPELKSKIPTDVLFARSGGEKIDLNMTLGLTGSGELEQQVKTSAGSPLHLFIRPENPASSITGQLMFISRNQNNLGALPQYGPSQKFSLKAWLNLAASSLANRYSPLKTMNLADISAIVSQAASVTSDSGQSKQLLLTSFNYEKSADGTYSADIQMPLIAGNYEVVTSINYEDQSLPSKEIKISAVIDPEGYVYEKATDGETRIANASVTLYKLNEKKGTYEIWQADQYGQENPQTTDIRGTYSFLVPDGEYRLAVSAAGFEQYTGQPFQIKKEDKDVYFPLELSKKTWLGSVMDFLKGLFGK